MSSSISSTSERASTHVGQGTFPSSEQKVFPEVIEDSRLTQEDHKVLRGVPKDLVDSVLVHVVNRIVVVLVLRRGLEDLWLLKLL